MILIFSFISPVFLSITGKKFSTLLEFERFSISVISEAICEKSSLEKLIISDEKFNKIIGNIRAIMEESKSWIFQGNPKIYDITKALQNGHLLSWKVAAHKDRIKQGDKVILWQTGEEAGCYALAEVGSEVAKVAEEPEELQYYFSASDKDGTGIDDRVKIEIIHNLANNPILWPEIKDRPEFENFKAGNQGTNFSATQEEYKTLVQIASNKLIGKMICK